jgi:hypothetical protein
MASIKWPSALPDCFLVDGWQETFANNTIRTNMDVGFSKVRKRGSSAPILVQGNMVMDFVDYARLKNFYNDTTGYGALRFDFDGWEVRFTQPPSVRQITANNVEISLQLEYLKEIIPPAGSVISEAVKTVQPLFSNLSISEQIGTIFSDTVDYITKTFGETNLFVRALTNYINTHSYVVMVNPDEVAAERVKSPIQQVFDALGLSGLFNTVTGTIGQFTKGSTGIIPSLLKTFNNVTGVNLANVINNVIDSLSLSSINDFLKSFGTNLTPFGNELKFLINNYMLGNYDINNFASGLWDVIRSFGSSLVGSGYSNILGALTNILQPAAQSLIKLGGTSLQSLDNILNSILTTYRQSFQSGILNFLLNIVMTLARSLFPTLTAPSNYFAKTVF